MEETDDGNKVSAENAQAARELGIATDAYDQLKRLAQFHLRTYRNDMTLNCTALVHEAYLKLKNGKADTPDSEDHYAAVASLAMRQILVDYIRKKNRIKRGGDSVRITLQESSAVTDPPSVDLLALDDALTRLAKTDPLLEKLVVMRFFGGFTVEDTAKALGRSVRSVERDWARARLYLYRDVGHS